jgi:cytidylate kinase
MRHGQVRGTNLKYHGNVYISGLTASGKTTHCYLLAGSFGLTYVSGSQIHLSINGMSPIQERKFWITETAKKLLTEDQFKKVDQELQRIERSSKGFVFDSWIMPWRKTSNGLTIYLKSSLKSRTMKAAVSRRENGFIIDNIYKEKIKEKDNSAIALYKKLHGVDIENDLSIFDIVIDNTSFIESPTFEASQLSIIKTHSIVQSAVGYYLTGNADYRRDLKKHCEQKYIVHNTLL